jgi:hypothetical protein
MAPIRLPNSSESNAPNSSWKWLKFDSRTCDIAGAETGIDFANATTVGSTAATRARQLLSRRVSGFYEEQVFKEDDRSGRTVAHLAGITQKQATQGRCQLSERATQHCGHGGRGIGEDSLTKAGLQKIVNCK